MDDAVQYAFDEFPRLIHRKPSHRPCIEYLCALIAELSYYHVPKLEIDRSRRAIIVPCEGYKMILRARIPTDVTEYIQDLDGTSFVVTTRRTVAVGLRFGKLLFVGLRGTQFLFDWRINVRGLFVDLSDVWRRRHTGLIAHRGFLEEAHSMSRKLRPKIREFPADRVFLAGHSLGGAVASLVRFFLGVPMSTMSTYVFGCPRYSRCKWLPLSWSTPVNIQRVGDVIPSLPPRSMKYCDPRIRLDTELRDLLRPNALGSDLLCRLARCAARRFKPHNVELYRREVGRTSNANLWNARLAPYDRLRKHDIG